jgi:hypothetical protein
MPETSKVDKSVELDKMIVELFREMRETNVRHRGLKWEIHERWCRTLETYLVQKGLTKPLV